MDLAQERERIIFTVCLQIQLTRIVFVSLNGFKFMMHSNALARWLNGNLMH
jgi:hypothetical protein